MMILTLRSDKPEAEIGLYNNELQCAYETWPAHRQLAETLHKKIETLLTSLDKSWQDIEGIVCFKGPGSFTGLRIGLTVANTIAYSYGIPIVAAHDPNWLEVGVQRVLAGESNTVAAPFYGAEVNITPQKK